MSYLRLLGNITAGWLLAMSARKAASSEGAVAPDFAEAKRRCARCFANTRLAESAMLHSQFVTAGEALHGLDPERHL